MRRKVIAGNWKMNKLPNEAMEFIERFAPLSKEINENEKEVILFVPYVDLFYSLLMVQETNIKIGAQNMHWEEKGAYTGEVSGQMLKSLGVKYVLIGHSERRQYFNETDETVNKKIKAALKNELKPTVCVGETLEQRNASKTNEVLEKQTKLALLGLNSDEVKKLIFAYEPVWAIGTGVTATVEDANDGAKIIRKAIEEEYGEDISKEIIIQYGGSVKSTNAKDIFEASDIDGGLIGGASLDVDEFNKIINYEK